MKRFFQTTFAILIIAALFINALEVRAESPRVPKRALTDGLVSYWTFDEASNTTRNDSVGGHHLSETGGSVTAISAKINNGVQGNTTSYLSVASTSDLRGGDRDFTINAWFNITTAGGCDAPTSNPIVTKDDVETAREYSLYESCGEVKFYIFDGGTGGVSLAQVASPSLDQWHFVSAWYDSTQQKTYIQLDGGSVHAGNSNIGTPSTGSAAFRIGRDYYPSLGDRTLHGAVDEVSFFSRTLTDDERSTLYNLGAGCTYSFVGCQSSQTYLQYIRQPDALSAYNWLSGSGYTVAIIDSGINSGLSKFSGKISYQYDFVNSDSTADDVTGHGTEVASIIVDVCPSCSLVILKISEGDEWQITIPYAKSALQWVINNHQTYNIVATNNSYANSSIGVFNTYDSATLGLLSYELFQLKQLDIVNVTSSGNSYVGTEGVQYPAADASAIGVGATFFNNVGSYTSGTYVASSTAPDQFLPFSMRSPIISPLVAGGALIPTIDETGASVEVDGTSFSSPQVAAAVALIQHAAVHRYGSKLTAQEVLNTLLSSGRVIADAPLSAVDNVAHHGGMYRVLDVKAAIDSVTNDTLAWRTGNYLEDGDMEYDTLYDNWWSPWFSTPSFSQSRESNYNSIAPLCGSYYRKMEAGIVGIGDPITGGNLLADAINTPAANATQSFLWYGGTMYVSFAYRTVGSAKLTAKILSPFYPAQTVALDVTNTASDWKIAYASFTNLPYGKYTLGFTVADASGYTALIDAASVSESGYVHCTYSATPLTPPPAFTAQQSQKSDPYATYNDRVSLVAADPNDSTYSGIQTVSLPVNVSTQGYEFWDAFGMRGISPAGRVVTKNWWETLATPNTPTSGRGFDFGQGARTVANALVIKFIADVAVNEFTNNIVALVNADTGQEISIPRNNLQATRIGNTNLHKYSVSVDVPPGRYRLKFGPANFSNATSRDTYYLTRICVLGYYSIVVLPECDLQPLQGELLYQWLINNPSYQLQVASNVSGTAIALATQAPFQTQNAQTQVARMYATQTALYQSGNATLQYQATQAQMAAATATQVWVSTGTAFVQGFNATNTAIAANRATQSAANVQVQTQQAINANIATQNAATQAAQVNTVQAPATMSGQLTATSYFQATLVQNQTALPNQQATVNYVGTQIKATSNAAATAYANNANATNAAAATQAQANVNAVTTAQAQNNATATANANFITQIAIGNPTVIFQATSIVQTQVANLPTLIAQGTQQVVTQPPMQPDFAWDANCNRPDNALNLAWWIDYEPCRVLAWFSWAPFNTTQVTTLPQLVADREPFATINNTRDFFGNLMSAISRLTYSDVASCDGTIFNIFPQTVPSALNGTLNLQASSGTAISTTCALPFDGILGTQIMQGACWGYNFMCYYGVVQLFRWALNIVAGVTLVYYVQATWMEQAQS